MGMFDTIHLDRKYTCPICGGEIDSIQIKAFDNMLEDYYVKDCISHAEEIRIIKNELFCDRCRKNTGVKVYIVVNRGILMGTAETLQEARKLLDELNLEKLILWYHDLYARYIRERNEKNSYRRFLENLHEWYGERIFEKEDEIRSLLFIHDLKHLKGTSDPIEAIERFLTYRKMLKALDELWEEGHDPLHISYVGETNPGDDVWSVDICQEEINDRCDMKHTWRVISRRMLEMSGRKEDELPEWEVTVDEPFSEETVRRAIERWLRDRGYEFEVRLANDNGPSTPLSHCTSNG